MKRAAFAVAAVVLLYAAPSRARTPEIAADPVNGIWIAQDDKFIFQTIDRWTVFAAGATVNKLVVDQNILWIATDDGVIRFETGSQRSTKLGMDDGLPSQRVSTVSFDDQYVWFGTNKGLVRYRKTDRTLKLYDESNGLPNKAVTYSVTIGRQVWFGTRAGIAVFSPDVDGLRAFGEVDGMASGEVAEVFQVGSDLWCRTDVGLSRFRIQQRVFNNFPLTLMGAQQLRVMAVDGADIWLGTDNGLFQFQDASDSIIPFPLQAALGSKMIVGVEPTSSYVYITTDKEVLQYSRTSMAIRRWTAAEGLVHQEGSTGTLTQGGFFTVMFPESAMMLNIQLDQWTDRKIEVKATSAKKTTGRVFGQLDSEMPYNKVHLGPGFLHGTPDKENQYANATGGFGFGEQLDKDRTLNGSVYLDYGQLNASGIRDLQYKIEYLGNQNDIVRDVRIEDKLKYRYVEEGLERQLLLQGAHVGMATPGAEPKASMSVDAGFRRGQVVRDFITGPRQDIYQLSQKYILPGTDRVYVDGELLNNGTDYTIVYTAGQLLFLNPERVDDLSVITVEYEHDLVPKKDLGNLSLSARLPVTNEVGTWALSGTPTIVSNDTALYSQIDGGAPKYIDRGWISSVYATYQQGGSSIQANIHNMGNAENAEALYQFQLPNSRLTINTLPTGAVNAVVDMGLSGAYFAEAFVDQYVIEVSIDDRSDAALAYVKTFTMEILNRSKQAGASLGDQFKEWMVATRVAASPVQGMEIGARAVELQQMSDTRDANGNLVSPALHLTTGALDGRYQTKVGSSGLLTSYAEVAGSHDSTGPRPDGVAGMGFLRLSSPTLEGMLSSRVNSEGWTPIGHTTPTPVSPSTRTWNDARMGTLRDETRFNVTGYPVAWLPVTALFTRQRAWLPDGSGGTGTLQHAIARIQLNRAGLPATTLQLSSTELDNPNGFQTHRLQGSLQTDYDLAPALAFTRIKKFNVRALYSLSQGETDENGTFAYEDRVRLMRFEGKLSPTATEAIYALYRSRDVGRQTESGSPFGRSLYHWELTSGAQSRIIPGLVPQLNYNLIYDDNRVSALAPAGTTGVSTDYTTGLGLNVNQWANTGPMGPAGSAFTPIGPGRITLQAPTVAVTGSMGAGLGIYPGQWWAKLAPLALSPSVAVGDSEETVTGNKTTYGRLYDFVVMEVWGGRKLEMQLYQRYRVTTASTVVQPDPHEIETTTTLQNRIVYRPIFTSPITLLLNYGRDRKVNDPTLIANAGPWSIKQTYQSQLQWLMRWNQKFTTRTTATGTLERAADYFAQDSNSGEWLPADHSKYSAYGEFQIRIYPLPEVSALYIYQTTGVTRWFGSGVGAFEAWEIQPAGGTIWRVGDKMYLDAQFTYDYLYCMSGSACSGTSRVLPHLYFTMNL